MRIVELIGRLALAILLMALVIGVVRSCGSVPHIHIGEPFRPPYVMGQ